MIMIALSNSAAFLAQAQPSGAEQEGEVVGACLVFLLFPIVFGILWFKFGKSKN